MRQSEQADRARKALEQAENRLVAAQRRGAGEAVLNRLADAVNAAQDAVDELA